MYFSKEECSYRLQSMIVVNVMCMMCIKHSHFTHVCALLLFTQITDRERNQHNTYMRIYVCIYIYSDINTRAGAPAQKTLTQNRNWRGDASHTHTVRAEMGENDHTVHEPAPLSRILSHARCKTMMAMAMAMMRSDNVNVKHSSLDLE